MHLFRDEIVPEIETSDNEHRSYDSEEDQIVRFERMAEDAPPLDNDFETEDAPLVDAPTTVRKEKGEVLRKTSKSRNQCIWNTMHWVNPAENGVGNMENKWVYVSESFPYCTHGTRFQRV